MSDLSEAVRALGYWYHRIELPGGIITPGWAPMIPHAYALPEDLTGARVLDVGAWDGYWSFEALRRGAAQVVAVDDFSDQIGWMAHGGAPWATFDLCREALGYDEVRCQRRDASVYDIVPEQFGTFDVVLCFGVLYHCRHPLLALDRLAAVAPAGDIYIESAVTDCRGAYEEDGYGKRTLAEFYPGAEYGSNPTNFWGPTLACLEAMTRAAGWPVTAGQRIAVPADLRNTEMEMLLNRGFVQGRRK